MTEKVMEKNMARSVAKLALLEGRAYLKKGRALSGSKERFIGSLFGPCKGGCVMCPHHVSAYPQFGEPKPLKFDPSRAFSFNKGGGGLFDPNKAGKAGEADKTGDASPEGIPCLHGIMRDPHNKRPCSLVKKAGEPIIPETTSQGLVLDRESLETLNLDDRRKYRGP